MDKEKINKVIDLFRNAVSFLDNEDIRQRTGFSEKAIDEIMDYLEANSIIAPVASGYYEYNG